MKRRKAGMQPLSVFFAFVEKRPASVVKRLIRLVYWRFQTASCSVSDILLLKSVRNEN